MPSDPSDAPGTGVTVHVVRPVPADHREPFERALQTAISAATRAPGHLGVEVLRPEGQGRDYHIIFRFDAQDRLDAWMGLADTEAQLAALDALTAGPAQRTVLTGLETWFTLPASPAHPPPPRWKMAVVTWLGLFPLVLLLLRVLEPVSARLPWPLPIGLTTMIAVAAMTWLVMPRLTRLFAGWLWPQR